MFLRGTYIINKNRDRELSQIIQNILNKLKLGSRIQVHLIVLIL